MVGSILPVRVEEATVQKKGKMLLGPISLSFSPEGVTAIMGPNGSGKTTLLRAMHGLERLSSGGVYWNGEPSPIQAHQAFVFQTPILLRRSVIGNLVYPLRLKGMAAAEARHIALDWLSKIGLKESAQLDASFLSGGEKQKLALARALVTSPQVLFLDEPTVNLDGRSTRDIETLITDATHEGVRVILATHDSGQAKRLADDVIFLLNGTVFETNSAKAFFAKPKTSQARAYLKGDIVE